MRCRPLHGDTKCERCSHKALDCVFQEHRRGRKPGTRQIASLAKRRPSTGRDENKMQETAATHENESDTLAKVISPDACSGQPTQQASLQPSGLLNREAMKGKFSLLRILSTDNDKPQIVMEEALAPPTQDAVRAGLVSQSIAEFLFDSFIKILNPYISQLDPGHHTFSYVRQRSSFLLSSILAASAKMFNPALYKPLRDYAEDMFVQNFRSGNKSTEIAQAVLILTYWKDPEDTRSWVTLGYVIRMCIDLGWHKLRPRSAQDREHLTETQRREARNVERTWFVLFVYDRSMSLQTGKPWMIERNGFLESIESWCKDSIATESDILLGALVTLRLLTSEVFRLLGPHRQTNSFQSTSSLLTIISNRIEEWENKWLHLYQNASESCHPFLIRFYGTHLRLQLYSLPLQEVLGSSQHDITYNLESLWSSYSSAIEMLKLVSHFSQFLYFAQDSIHVMTAYAAAFLIKILMSAPRLIVSEIESVTIETIRTAAAVFSQQSAPNDSSCFLQSRFLSKITSDYDDIRQRNTEKQSSLNPRSSTPYCDVNTSTVDNSTDAEGTFDTLYQESAAPYESNETFQQLCTSANTTIQRLENVNRESRAPNLAEKIDFILADNDVWTNALASAGFNAQDVFLFS
ncbi:hypothetical protein BGW36DRAFT_400737 [Talaromyces proteolyticus]|uniref:Xylanolytic transcriptional activator regulatory domain-containing protein n=1 Tax=Talaromyces proteolyticus TaxID=1131652 RepID=A0AAD4PW33_9EURO|nr:uncharacterized protein BGW36DRAFT_400737 [Talaromyces proteolyticus]KAH8691462.1 hypothetical protein BGW36DRAFT_400737 [Talaromyces proteolyticus]